MEYNVIGLMSGTSLDGLDVALCNFKFLDKKWRFEIFKAKTFEYNDFWKDKLTNASEISAFEFIKLHKEYGRFIGQLVNNFLKEIKQSYLQTILSIQLPKAFHLITV